MKRVLCSDWLPEQAVWAFLVRLGFPNLVPQEKSFLFGQTINPLFTNSSLFGQDAWILAKLFCRFIYLDFVSVYENEKKRTWPLSSHLHWTSWSITHICFERTTCARHTYRRHSSCSRWDRYFHVVAGATPESSSLLQSLCSTIFFSSFKTMVIGPAKATELAGPVCWLFH